LSLTSIAASPLAAAAGAIGLVLRAAPTRHPPGRGPDPASLWQMPDLAAAVEPDEGPVRLPSNTDRPGARGIPRSLRERPHLASNGLLDWNLFSDRRAGRYIEHMPMNGAAYVRRNER
jgi:hypothetical protein